MVDIVANKELDKILELNDLDVLAAFFAAVIHDFKHPGYNNGFLINSKSLIAIEYNGKFFIIKIDKSVLENYHIAETFKLLNEKECNILEKLDNQEYKLFRKRIIEAVLSTDMAMHSKLVGIISSKVSSDDFIISKYLESNSETNKFEFQQDIINFVLHAVDIGHGAKPFKLELKWADLVTQEFHNQGDVEKKLNLPISFLCDRTTANIPASQVGFIAGIVLPTFQLVHKICPKTFEYVQMLETSKEEWEKLKKII